MWECRKCRTYISSLLDYNLLLSLFYTAGIAAMKNIYPINKINLNLICQQTKACHPEAVCVLPASILFWHLWNFLPQPTLKDFVIIHNLSFTFHVSNKCVFISSANLTVIWDTDRYQQHSSSELTADYDVVLMDHKEFTTSDTTDVTGNNSIVNLSKS